MGTEIWKPDCLNTGQNKFSYVFFSPQSKRNGFDRTGFDDSFVEKFSYIGGLKTELEDYYEGNEFDNFQSGNDYFQEPMEIDVPRKASRNSKKGRNRFLEH